MRDIMVSALSGLELLQVLRSDFFGLDTRYRLVSGDFSERVYLDSAATCLPMNAVRSAAAEFLRHYANTHSSAHFSARVTTSMYRWAHQRILDFLGADAATYACLFVGNGATAGFNRVAHLLHGLRPQRDTVLVSLMEHHSNDLPHRRLHRQVVRIPTEHDASGRLCLDALSRLLETHREAANYVAVTAASNVTGIRNPVAEIIRMAHAHGAYVVVDASQAVAHDKFDLGPGGNCAEVDAFVFSGHKLYAPGSPGVLVCRKSLLARGEPYEIGGGTVDHVYLDRYELLEDFPEREEAGTPNIPGAVALAFTVELLDRIGMDVIARDEHRLLQRLDAGFSAIDDLQVYGVAGVPLEERTPTLSFAMRGIDHGLLAAILNDYFNIAVRNQCFCAHPYVRELIKRDLWALPDELLRDRKLLQAKQGLVRVSLGLYNDEADIDHLLMALREIGARREFYCSNYLLQPDGSYRHRDFNGDENSIFHPIKTLDRVLGARMRRVDRHTPYDLGRPITQTLWETT